MATRVFAPAKINLTLHVTGQREDGYHLLDSLVMFADVGDWVTCRPADVSSLVVTGPMAEGVPTDKSNLVLRAVEVMGTSTKITLEKHLPAAAGIGGGSSDAAATLRAIAEMTGAQVPENKGISLGADVPVCTLSRAATMRGIGEDVTAIRGLPALPAALVNPRVAVPTPAVFRALKTKDNPPMSAIPTGSSVTDLCDWLGEQRNDLEPPARQEQPVIDDVLTALDGALLARMSGSGATCFGLYPSVANAKDAAQRIQAAHPNWWVMPTVLS